MSAFYTNVALHRGKIYLREIVNGKRQNRIIPFKPYLFLESSTPTEHTTIDGKYVSKIDFDSTSEAYDFMRKYEEVEGFKYYGFDRWAYVFVQDNYPGAIDYDANKIRVAAIDIETDTTDGYPNIELADKKITAITIGYKSARVVFGYKPYKTDRPNVKYIKCFDEEHMLRAFLDVWNTISPDVVTGWNIPFFDIPYLVTRINRILGDGPARRLSPWGILQEREINTFGKDIMTYVPLGVAILDYMDLYKKFTYNQRESYSLNNIAHVELDEKKIDYSEFSGLAELYEKDHSKFIEYNIHDVDLIFKLDEKMKLIDLVYSMAYDAKTNYTDTFTTVLYWDVLIYNFLAQHNIVIPKYEKKLFREFEGGYVKEPQIGMFEHVVSCDLTSLYPKTICQYNIGPETLAGKMSNMNVDNCIMRAGNPYESEFSVAANGCYYRKDRKSLFATIIDIQFAQRVEAKNKMLEAKKRKTNKEGFDIDIDNEIAKYNNLQMAKKIQLNSLYGAIANEGFRYFNVDNAEAITLSGQLAIRWIEKIVNWYVNKLCDTNGKDYVIAIDTDSLYINFGPYVKLNKPDDPVEFLDQFCKTKLEPVIKRGYEELAKHMNAYQNAMEMKREVIGKKAIWVAKKRYMITVEDSEGVRYTHPELKTMGIETVRSSTPEICREALKEAIMIIMTQGIDELKAFNEKFRQKFYAAPFEDIAFPRGVNGIDKYNDPVKIYKLKTPIHVRGALIYNKLQKERGYKSMPPIYDGDKIKFAYLKMPNPTHGNVIAAPNHLPFKDLEPFIDYAEMFEKAYLEPVTKILEAIGWSLSNDAALDFEEMFA